MKRIRLDGVLYNAYITEDGRVFTLGMKERKYKLKKYKYVTLSLGGERVFIAVHRLVAIHYIPNPLNKPCVNHRDGDKLNNKVSNLEWVTYSENTIHAYDIGLKKPPEKEKNPFFNHDGKWLRDRSGKNNPNYKHGEFTNKQ